jgi:hypothetical protein
VSDLRDFAEKAINRMTTDEPPPDDDVELELEDTDAGDDEPEPDPALAERFFASLDENTRAAWGDLDDETSDRLWAEFLTAEGIGSYLDDEQDDAEPEAEASEAQAPTTGLAIIEAAYAAESAGTLVDEDDDPISASSFLAWAVRASDREWAKVAKAAGWSPSVRVSSADLRSAGRGVQGSVLAADWAEEMERRRERIEREGRGYFQ